MLDFDLQIDKDFKLRLTQHQSMIIKQITADVAGATASVRLFGSRLDDQKKGGDVDLMVEIPSHISNPAVIAATISAKVAACMHGRKVDVLLSAPNLMRLPIHAIAYEEGVLL